MTEAEWLAAIDPQSMIGFVRIKVAIPRSRKLRLFSIGCCRHLEYALIDSRSLRALTTFEQYLEGEATEVQWQQALDDADTVMRSNRGLSDGQYVAASTVYSAIFDVTDDESRLARNVASGAAKAAKVVAYERDYDVDAGMNANRAESTYQAALIRDIFGNPFRSVAFSPDWRTDTVVSLAKQMYDSRDFGAMPILADALQDAGCDNTAILEHCRDPKATHVRGCWVVDLVLGKE
jgi:hypothetical protein